MPPEPVQPAASVALHAMTGRRLKPNAFKDSRGDSFAPAGAYEISRWREPPGFGMEGTRAPAGAPETASMPSTHLSLHFHVVFSTKNREPRIAAEWRDRLHAYLGGVARKSGCIAEAVGGVADHAHLLLGLNATTRLADVIRDIKAVSAKWIHEETGDRAFSWQEGYGAFSVSPSHRENVRGYIARQEEHHRKRTFQKEYLELLNHCGVDFDERYLW